MGLALNDGPRVPPDAGGLDALLHVGQCLAAILGGSCRGGPRRRGRSTPLHGSGKLSKRRQQWSTSRVFGWGKKERQQEAPRRAVGQFLRTSSASCCWAAWARKTTASPSLASVSPAEPEDRAQHAPGGAISLSLASSFGKRRGFPHDFRSEKAEVLRETAVLLRQVLAAEAELRTELRERQYLLFSFMQVLTAWHRHLLGEGEVVDLLEPEAEPGTVGEK